MIRWMCSCRGNQRTDTIFVHANHDANPWFPAELRADMEYDSGAIPIVMPTFG